MLSLCKVVIADVIQDATNVCPAFSAMGQFGHTIDSDKLSPVQMWVINDSLVTTDSLIA